MMIALAYKIEPLCADKKLFLLRGGKIIALERKERKKR